MNRKFYLQKHFSQNNLLRAVPAKVFANLFWSKQASLPIFQVIYSQPDFYKIDCSENDTLLFPVFFAPQILDIHFLEYSISFDIPFELVLKEIHLI